MKAFLVSLVFATGGGAYYLYVYRPSHSHPVAAAYALGKSVKVVDAPSEIHLNLATLKAGEKVEVFGRRGNWVRVRLADMRLGWVESKTLVDGESYDAAQKLAREVIGVPVLITGHTSNLVNLHLEPARESQSIAQLAARQRVEILGRHLVERPPPGPGPSTEPTPESSFPPPPKWEAWYLVRADSQVGWVLGRLIELDIPEAIGTYAQGFNVVACMVLNEVEDGGQTIPQYLIADRVGTQQFDFSHIRVLTWWKKKQKYATAYVESRLNGYFPLEISQIDGNPYFRLRLVDNQGRKFQKGYVLVDTLTLSLGAAPGWESNAIPVRLITGSEEGRKPRGARKRSRS